MKKYCRMTNFGQLEEESFNFLSCYKCFEYLDYVFDGFNSSLQVYQQLFFKGLDKDSLNEFKNLMKPIEFKKWQQCCIEAQNCCQNEISLNNESNVNLSSDYCEPIWDGWSCHSKTAAGFFSKVKCPEYHVENTCSVVLGQY